MIKSLVRQLTRGAASLCVFSLAAAVSDVHAQPLDFQQHIGPARSDLAFRTELWRREFFLPTETKEEDTEEEQAADSTVDGNDSTASESLEPLANITDAMIDEGTIDQVSSPDSNQVVADIALTSLSDWEQAVCNATRSVGNTMGQQGPSILTVVVGVVGAIVVCGAYFKSSR